MSKKASQWLSEGKRYAGQKPGNALVKWLNGPDLSPKFLEDLLQDAQVVFRGLAEYGSLHELKVAGKQNKLPPAFWECHARLNERLATFTYVPEIDLHEFSDGERVSWTLVSDDAPSREVRWVLQLIEQGAILRIRRCQQCAKWFFAHFAHQAFCTTPCRLDHQAGTEKFKKKRREYMRKYNYNQKHKNVK
jgi:hypothetical protein